MKLIFDQWEDRIFQNVWNFRYFFLGFWKILNKLLFHFSIDIVEIQCWKTCNTQGRCYTLDRKLILWENFDKKRFHAAKSAKSLRSEKVTFSISLFYLIHFKRLKIPWLSINIRMSNYFHNLISTQAKIWNLTWRLKILSFK